MVRLCVRGEPDTGGFHSSYIGMNVHVVLPKRLGAWSMACMLRQWIEYYYYYYASL